MINISNIELNKKFIATIENVKAVVNYRIDEDWFSVYYYNGDEFLFKDVRHADSEQKIIKTISRKIHYILSDY